MPELVVLGTAQDGGMPHAGCRCVNCERARRDPGFRRLPPAVGIRAGDATALIDATHAFAEQVHLLQSTASDFLPEKRYAPPATVLLTHTHTGHYVGLWQLDRSVLSAKAVRVLGPPQTIALLATNEPWRQMVVDGFITLAPLALNTTFEVVPGVQVTPMPVPHRSEWGADTVAYRIDGPNQSVLYLPDIDAWDVWEQDVCEVVASVDVALLDGTFWEPFSRPGVPHPPVRDSLDRLASVARDGQSQIIFTHLNHTNPAVDPDSAEAIEVRERGFAVADEGQIIPL